MYLVPKNTRTHTKVPIDAKFKYIYNIESESWKQFGLGSSARYAELGMPHNLPGPNRTELILKIERKKKHGSRSVKQGELWIKFMS